MSKEIEITGIPNNSPDSAYSSFYAKLHSATNSFIRKAKLDELEVNILYNEKSDALDQTKNSQTATNAKKDNITDEIPVEHRAEKYKSLNPLYQFNQLVLDQSIYEDIVNRVEAIELDEMIFEKWGLKHIEPFSRTALNFWGLPGTGKTLAAHAIASKLSKKILTANYAQVESMYHGIGPQNLDALFFAAQRDNSVLFIDEADSLLSRRPTEITTGSESAVNAMRTQLMICIQNFKGIIIFATNRIDNFDKAFLSRMFNIYFPLPNRQSRCKIWEKHLSDVPGLPVSNDVCFDTLSEYELSGRDIKEAVISAARYVALQVKKSNRGPEQELIGLTDLIQAILQIENSKKIIDNTDSF